MTFKRGLFFSLKWQAFIITSIVLLTCSTAFVLINNHQIQENFRQEGTDHLRDLLRETEESIQQQERVHENIGKTIFVYKNIIPALKKSDKKSLIDAFEPNWWKIQIDTGIGAAFFYDKKAQLITHWGEADARHELVHNVLDSGRFQHYISCKKECALYSIIPVFDDGSPAGSVLFAANLSPSLLNFKEIMETDIGIIIRPPNSAKDWSSGIIAFTGWDSFRYSIEEIVSKSSLQTLINHNIQFNQNNHTYNLIITPYINKEINSEIYLLYIYDITSLILSQRKSISNTVGMSILAVIFSEVFLMLILWGPLSRLKAITHRLPALTSEYAAFLAEFPREIKHRFFTDETDVVLFSAQKLALQLKKYNHEVQSRTTDLENQKNAFLEEKQFIEVLINTAQAMIITLDENANISMINRYGHWLTGYRAKELVGKPLAQLFSDDEYQDIKSSLQAVINGTLPHYNHHSQLHNKHGEIFYLAWYHSCLPNRNNTQQKTVSIALDISDRKRVEEHLGWLASHDPLTGLYNRRRFSEEIEHVIATSHRYAHTSALLFFDLDNFKDINDIHGHHTGDEILKKVSRALNKCARESDVVARLGGDEFAVILKETNAGDAMVSADRFCQAVNAVTENIGGRALHISASIGVALYPTHGSNLKTLLANADIAMYQAKEAGRNRCSLYEEKSNNQQATEKRVYWNQKIREIIENNCALIYYQPIYDIGQKRVCHYEALLRISDGDKILPPAALIHAAERAKSIFDLDMVIMEQVIKDIARLNELNIQTKFSVNVSGLSFQQPSLVGRIRQFLALHRVDPQHLICEITETAAVQDVTLTTQVMHDLRALGIEIALDDFGVGFSSIYYLKHFPFNQVKIDGSFIRNLHYDQDSQILVKAIVDVAKAFGLKTVAEFVENEEILLRLQDMQVDFAQGYFINHPLPLEQIFKLK
jgi:diguanylate cyclase (GGDEF)-like protein/PAS domain S-box-containing protein